MKHTTGQLPRLENTCVSFGYFDGLHLGHRAVLDCLLAQAETGLRPVLLSFDCQSGTKKLCTEAEKAYLLKDLPVQLLSFPVAEDFCPDGPFVQEVLLGQLGAKTVVAGENCPSLALLQAHADAGDFALVLCPTVCQDGEPVSTSRASQLLASGQLDKLNRLLGHPYLILGKVVEGKQLGRTVGMPTANIEYFEDKQIPPEGVYATFTSVEGNSRKSLTNIGKRPSVDKFDYITVECFILDFCGDLYGRVLPIEVHLFIRGVKKFANLGEVKEQVERDILAIRGRLESAL